MKNAPLYSHIIPLACALAALTPNLTAQVTAPSSASGDEERDVVELSPFEVNAQEDSGYIARNTLAGSRLNTSLRDVASQVSVMTPEFLQDVGAVTIDEALLYSLNTENTKEFYDVVTNNNATLTNNPQGGNNRTRGIGQQVPTIDFFETSLPQDTYNTDRVTFVYGPNAILFGSGDPSGNIDATLKRARASRPTYEVELRVDSENSWRIAFDANVPIVKDALAIRIAGMKQNQKEFRDPNFDKQDRFFATLQFDPYKWLSIRGWYESMNRDRQPLRNTLVNDAVTPWLQAGRPLYDNSVGRPLPANTDSPTAAGYDPLFKPYIDNQRPLVLLGQTIGDSPAGLMYHNRQVVPRGLAEIRSAPDNFDATLADASAFPLDVNFYGDAFQNRAEGINRGVSINVNPLPGLFLEFGNNVEDFRHEYVDLVPFGTSELRVDPNMYLPDGVTPNPNVGRYYFFSGPDTGNNFRNLKTSRYSASYELKFTDRDDWAKWLGRHRLGGFHLAREAFGDRQRSDFRLINNPASLPGLTGDPANTLNANTRDVRMRLYVDDPTRDPSGTFHVSLPFDPFAPGTLPGTDWQVATLDNPFGARDPQLQSRSVLDSEIVSIQSYLLKDKVVLTYGKRWDSVENYGLTTTVQSGNYVGTYRRTGTTGPGNSGVSNQAGYDWWYNQLKHPENYVLQLAQDLKTDIKSIVVHPFRWFSLYYNESNTANPQGSIKLNLDGSVAEIGNGLGKDYGVTFSLFRDQLVLRANQFELVQPNGISQYRAFTGIGGLNPFRDAIHNIERSVRTYVPSGVAGLPTTAAPASTAFAAYSDAMAGLGLTGGNSFRETYDVTSDKKATGYEFELVANPSPAWRIAISAAKTKPVEANIAAQWFGLIEERLPVWAEYKDVPVYTAPNLLAGSATVGDLVRDRAINSWNFIKQNEGNVVPQTRLWRMNLTTRYSFLEGRLKGAHVGGSVRWRDKTALGYGTRLATGAELPYTTGFLAPTDTLLINDLQQPILGPDLLEFDGFIGYARKIFENRVNWRVQLNIRNLLDEQDRVPQRLLSTGDVAVFTIPSPRTFILTNTFTF
jgi:outer membrane receptor protein involved in Fe transport